MNKIVKCSGAVGVGAVVLWGSPGTASAAPDDSQSTHAYADETQRAQRSVDVTLVNWSSCDLVFTGTSIPHGIWITVPPQTLEPEWQATWRTESNGIFTGTEASASWITANCGDRTNKNRNVWFHWSSPWAGSANYSGGADSPFSLTWNGDAESNATVTVFFEGP